MSAKKKDTKEGEKVEEKEKKPEGLGLLEEVREIENLLCSREYISSCFKWKFRYLKSMSFVVRQMPLANWSSVSVLLSLKDDEFEEFPADEWSDNEEDAEDVNVWEDNWDEDTVEDDFSKQLKTELEKASKSQDVEMKSWAVVVKMDSIVIRRLSSN